MPILLWLLGVPIVVIILLYLSTFFRLRGIRNADGHFGFGSA
jgi:hypothetical protein